MSDAAPHPTLKPCTGPACFLDRTTPPHLITLVLVAGLAAMSMNVFLPSLPGMAAYFGTDYAVMQLSVSAYLMAVAVLQLIVGPLADRFGRRRVLLWSTGLFAVATLGTLMAPTAELFLIFRMMQAVVAAGLVLSRTIVRDLFDTDEAASMIGYVTMGMALVPLIAPGLGGMLDQAFGWRAPFSLLLVCAIAMVALLYFDLGETARRTSASFAEQMRDTPELLRARRFWGYVACAAFCSGAFFAFLGGAPYLGSEHFGLAPGELGLYLSTPALGYVAGNFIAGRYSKRIGVNRMIFWGTLLTTGGLVLSLALYAWGLQHPLTFFGLVASVGLGNGMALPNANAGLLSVRPHLAGTASGLGGAFMIGGGAAMSVLAGLLLGPDTGPYPLQALMIATSAASIAAILYVIKRERTLASR
ncbi:MAG: multidrug effflux MFS transporter [Dinoroseobacter sp.]|nr:multidrug effflux MFS transporter [Dinoroseobacter sp.]MDJ0992176.1 multidrug effflux MFS transporter [Dinoroseobacter sp.]